jgi:hypothetical protein
MEAVEYGDDSRGIQTPERLRWRGPATAVDYRPALSLERPPRYNKHPANKLNKLPSFWSSSELYRLTTATGRQILVSNFAYKGVCRVVSAADPVLLLT